MSERSFAKWVGDYLKGLQRAGKPVWFMKTWGGPRQKRGIPDYLVIANGRWLFMELKIEEGEVTKLQAEVMRRISAAGGHALVVRTREEVRAAIEERLRAGEP